jgi:archaellum component FlaC
MRYYLLNKLREKAILDFATEQKLKSSREYEIGEFKYNIDDIKKRLQYWESKIEELDAKLRQ